MIVSLKHANFWLHLTLFLVCFCSHLYFLVMELQCQLVCWILDVCLLLVNCYYLNCHELLDNHSMVPEG